MNLILPHFYFNEANDMFMHCQIVQRAKDHKGERVREGATKAVLLIADAAPHSVGYTYPRIVKDARIDWRGEARKAAEKGIKFDTLSIHGTEWYKELSAITNGTYAPFKSSEKTAQVVEASVLSKVAATRDAFKATMDSVMLSSDNEMKAVYSAYSKEVL